MVKQTKQQRLANSARERRCIQRKYSNNSSSSHLSLSSRSYNRLDSDTMNQLLIKKNIDRLTSSLPMPIHNDHKRKRYGYTKQQQSNNASAIVAVTDLSMLPFKSYKKHVLWLSASQQDIANYSTASLSRELEYFAEYVKPDASEELSRTSMLLDIQDAVLSKYPTATIRPFGSHSVGLATFMSDIDISIDNIPLDTDMLANNNADKSASQSITGSTGSSVMRSVDKEVPGLLRLHQSFSQPAVDRNTPPPPSSSSSITRSTAIKNSHDKSALGLGTGDRVDNRVTWSIDRAPDKVVAVNSPHSSISHTKVAADDDADGRDADAVTGDGRYEKKAKANDECTDHTLDGIQMVYDLSYDDDDDDDRCIIDYDESTGTSDNSDHEEYNPSKKHKPLSMKTPQQQQQQLSTDIDVIFLDCEDQLQNAATTQQSSSDVITLDDDVMQSLNSGMRRARRYGSRRLSGASDNSGTDDGQRRTSKVKVLQRLYSLIQSMGWIDKIELRRHARIPIINLLHKNGIECDISLEMSTANTSLVVQILKDRCGDSKLFILSSFLKVFLSQLDLDRPFTGGLGSFKLYVLLSKHIQSCTRMDLGSLLMSFLEFYGNKRNLNESTKIEMDCTEEISFDRTSKIEQIRSAFHVAFSVLDSLLSQPKLSWKMLVQQQQAAAKSPHYSDTSTSMLACLINCEYLRSQRSKYRHRCNEYPTRSEKDREYIACQILQQMNSDLPTLTYWRSIQDTNPSLAARLRSYASVDVAVPKAKRSVVDTTYLRNAIYAEDSVGDDRNSTRNGMADADISYNNSSCSSRAVTNSSIQSITGDDVTNVMRGGIDKKSNDCTMIEPIAANSSSDIINASSYSLRSTVRNTSGSTVIVGTAPSSGTSSKISGGGGGGVGSSADNVIDLLDDDVDDDAAAAAAVAADVYDDDEGDYYYHEDDDNDDHHDEEVVEEDDDTKAYFFKDSHSEPSSTPGHGKSKLPRGLAFLNPRTDALLHSDARSLNRIDKETIIAYIYLLLQKQSDANKKSKYLLMFGSKSKGLKICKQRRINLRKASRILNKTPFVSRLRTAIPLIASLVPKDNKLMQVRNVVSDYDSLCCQLVSLNTVGGEVVDQKITTSMLTTKQQQQQHHQRQTTTGPSPQHIALLVPTIDRRGSSANESVLPSSSPVNTTSSLRWSDGFNCHNIGVSHSDSGGPLVRTAGGPSNTRDFDNICQLNSNHGGDWEGSYEVKDDHGHESTTAATSSSSSSSTGIATTMTALLLSGRNSSVDQSSMSNDVSRGPNHEPSFLSSISSSNRKHNKRPALVPCEVPSLLKPIVLASTSRLLKMIKVQADLNAAVAPSNEVYTKPITSAKSAINAPAKAASMITSSVDRTFQASVTDNLLQMADKSSSSSSSSHAINNSPNRQVPFERKRPGDAYRDHVSKDFYQQKKIDGDNSFLRRDPIVGAPTNNMAMITHISDTTIVNRIGNVSAIEQNKKSSNAHHASSSSASQNTLISSQQSKHPLQVASVPSQVSAQNNPMPFQHNSNNAPASSQKSTNIAPVPSQKSTNIAPVPSQKKANNTPLTHQQTMNNAQVHPPRGTNSNAPLPFQHNSNNAPASSQKSTNNAPASSQKSTNIAPVPSQKSTNNAPVPSQKSTNIAHIASMPSQKTTNNAQVHPLHSANNNASMPFQHNINNAPVSSQKNTNNATLLNQKSNNNTSLTSLKSSNNAPASLQKSMNNAQVHSTNNALMSFQHNSNNAPASSQKSANIAPVPGQKSTTNVPVPHQKTMNNAQVHPPHSTNNNDPLPFQHNLNNAPASSQKSTNFAPVPSQKSTNVAPVPSQKSTNFAPVPGQKSTNIAPVPSQKSTNIAPVPSQKTMNSAQVHPPHGTNSNAPLPFQHNIINAPVSSHKSNNNAPMSSQSSIKTPKPFEPSSQHVVSSFSAHHSSSTVPLLSQYSSHNVPLLSQLQSNNIPLVYHQSNEYDQQQQQQQLLYHHRSNNGNHSLSSSQYHSNNSYQQGNQHLSQQQLQQQQYNNVHNVPTQYHRSSDVEQLKQKSIILKQNIDNMKRKLQSTKKTGTSTSP